MSRAPDLMVLYLVIRTSLGMNAGKVGASCGHAVHQLTRHFYTDDLLPTSHWEAFYIWQEEDAPSYAKIALGASDEEFERVKEWARAEWDRPGLFHLVVDRGFSQVPEGAETCIGLWPMRKSRAPECLSTLKPLR